MLYTLILYISNGTYSLKSTPNDRFSEKLFIAILFTLRVFARNLLRGNRRRNIIYTITNYILIIYGLSNFDQLLGVVSQARVSGGNRTHDPQTNSLAHYPLDYQATHFFVFEQIYSFIQKANCNNFKASFGH